MKHRTAEPIKRLFTGLLAVTFLTGLPVNYAESADQAEKPSHEMPMIKPPAEFEQLKRLVGSWEGIHESPQGKQPAVVEYRLTSAGTAITETMFPGTKQEMISIYHGDANRIMMTHYCAFGNQPRMKMIPGNDPNVIKFVYMDGTNIQPDKDPHMHQLTLSFVNDNQILQDWVSFENGKPGHKARFDFKRVK